VILLGSSGVGKTSLLIRFVDNIFTNKYRATIGADFRQKDITVNDQIVSLQIWDTAGQERFQTLQQPFYRGADICMLVFDVSRTETFEALESWHDEFMLRVEPEDAERFPMAVLGNKSDLTAQREVSKNRALNWCKHAGNISYFETSAKQAMHVNHAFLAMAEKAMSVRPLSKQVYRPQPGNTVFVKNAAKQRPGLCCR
jgi:Ras-related protein Rab-7A